MSLQHDRIAELCEQLKFARLGSDWPALAQDAARDGASFAASWRTCLRANKWRVRSASARY